MTTKARGWILRLQITWYSRLRMRRWSNNPSFAKTCKKLKVIPNRHGWSRTTIEYIYIYIWRLIYLIRITTFIWDSDISCGLWKFNEMLTCSLHWSLYLFLYVTLYNSSYWHLLFFKYTQILYSLFRAHCRVIQN